MVVYLGRAGATPQHLRNRWESRLDAFEDAPSTHCMVIARASTARIRSERWEDAGLRIVRALGRSNALCVANAQLGSSGPWPETRDTVLYLVARKKRGPIGCDVPASAVNRAIVELLDDDNLGDDVAREVRLVARPEQAEDHEVLVGWGGADEEDDEDTRSLCRHGTCCYRALSGNYGFCGRHR